MDDSVFVFNSDQEGGSTVADTIREALFRHGANHFSVCRYDTLSPLLPCRAMTRLPRHPQSVIVFVFPYYQPVEGPRNVALYAVPDDYHTVAGGILQDVCAALSRRYPGEEFVSFVDNSPIPEKMAARLAGLGVIGRHGQLIHPDFGAYVLIGEVVTTLAITPSSPLEGGCRDCGACIRACPTGALEWDKPLDRSLCRSAITQKKGNLSPWEEDQVRLGGMVWGCDLCLLACPLHAAPLPSPIPAFGENPAPWLEPASLERLLPVKAYSYRPKEVLLRNYHLAFYRATQQE